MPKQTASAAQFSSVTNHQSAKRLQAVWLVGNEIGFSLERTQHTRVAFFNGILGMLLESLVWPPPVDRRGRRTVHGSEEIWERSACLLVSEVERGRELSGTPVSRVNKVHLLIPSSVVRCQHLKTQPHLFLPASVSLYFHAHINTLA